MQVFKPGSSAPQGFHLVGKGDVLRGDLLWKPEDRLWRSPELNEEGTPVRVHKKVARPNPPKKVPCCERDHDGDGNCDRHPAK